MVNAKRILSITVKRLEDDSPDTSWLGEYASRPNGDYSIDRKHSLDCPINNPQESANICNCDESGDWSHSEYQYFNTSGNYTGEPLTDIVQYTKRDYARMESLNAGNWCFLGIRAQAEIVAGNVCQKITSGGLWGIESDSDESYLKEVESEELSELRGILHEMGFSKRAIAQAVKTANLSE